MDVVHQHTGLKPILRKVCFNALLLLQASPARVYVTDYVLDLNAVSRSVLIPHALKGTRDSANKRVNNVCAKSNVGLITEEAESPKGTVCDESEKTAHSGQVEVMMPTCNRAKSAANHTIRKRNDFKYHAVGFFVATEKSLL
jgi:hypothetical protein